MTHNGSNRAYEVALAPAAIRLFRRLRIQPALAEALETELANGPNNGNEIRFDSYVRGGVYPGASQDDVFYTATPLSYAGYTAVHRPMTEDEIERLRREQGRAMARQGFYVIDILPAESAFSRSLRLISAITRDCRMPAGWPRGQAGSAGPAFPAASHPG